MPISVMNICIRARAQLHLFDPYVQASVLAQEVESVLTDAGEIVHCEGCGVDPRFFLDWA